MDRNHMLPPLELALAPPPPSPDDARNHHHTQGLHHQHHHHQHQNTLFARHDEYYTFSTGAAPAPPQAHPRSASQLLPPPTYAQSFHDFPSPSSTIPSLSHVFPNQSAATATSAAAPSVTTQLPPLQLQSSPDAVHEQPRLPSLATLTGDAHPPPHPHPHPYSRPSPIPLPHPPPLQLPPVASLCRPSSPSNHNKREHPAAQTTDALGAPQPHHWPSINPLTAYYSPPPPPIGSSHMSEQSSAPVSDRTAVEMDVNRLVDCGLPPIASQARVLETRASSVSLDDPEVRIAAQALSDLRTDFSPRKRHGSLSTTMSASHESMVSAPQTTTTPGQPEPLLSLLTTSHPFLGRTISNATAAYATSKNSSALFRSSAEYVEGYLTPLANTVGSVSRLTGVEGGVRWYLNSRRPPPSDVGNGSGSGSGSGSNKRRRIDYDGPEDETRGRTGEIDPNPHKNRRLSSASTVDTLPAYEEFSPSPAYSKTASEIISPDRLAAPSLDWQSRIITSTSGLGVAMSEESLRRLKYCLSFIRRVNSHINGTVSTLKRTLEQYEQAEPEPAPASSTHAGRLLPLSSTDEESQGQHHRNGDSRTVLAARLDHLRNEVMSTLKKTIDTVSRYAGGALPDNARVLVRRHLKSLPQRFRIASMLDGNLGARRASAEAGSADGETNTAAKHVRERAHMAIVAANAGLDVVDQVGRILDGTITSAEEWCERLGRSVSNSQPTSGAGESDRRPEKHASGDVKMV